MALIVEHFLTPLPKTDSYFTAQDLKAFFEKDEAFEGKPRVYYYISGCQVGWVPEDDTTNAKLLHLALSTILERPYHLRSHAQYLKLVTYENAFGIMSLEGFTLKCPRKV
jgi:hypothetical protein